MLKNKTIFKSIAVALIMFMMVAALSPSVGTVYAAPDSITTPCGENLDATIYVRHIKITGIGSMYDYSPDSPAPWADLDFQNTWTTLEVNIQTIEIDSGVNRIGSYAFANCTNLTSITYAGTKEQWNAITKGSYWDSNTGDYTITCSDGTIAKSDALSGSVDTGSGNSGNDNPSPPSGGQTVEGSNGNKGYTNVEYTVAQTGWTFSVPAAQTFTKGNLTLYGNVSISPESGKDIISLPSGQTINMTFTAANFNNGVFELRNGSNSVIPYKIGQVTRIASEGVAEEVSDITSNGCTVLTYMAGSSANTGVTNKLRFATTLENIKNAKVTGLHTDTLTFTVNVTGGTSGGGSESGGGSTTTPTLISFTIGSKSYQAEEGMTWADWVDSEYNTDGWIIVDNAIQDSIEAPRTIANTSSTDLIIAEHEYTVIPHTGGGAN